MQEKALRKAITILLDDWPNCCGVVTTGVRRVGTPDVIGSVNGQSFAWELKRSGERPRPNQLIELAKWEAAGARVAVIQSVDDAIIALGG